VEAFASGLPVISTDVGGIREHLDDNMGFLINKGDEKALLEKMNFMLDHYLDYDKTFLHDYAFKKFSYETIGHKFENIYKMILND
jgi:glycosyltransferase involved in cell wall biosynthesis